MKTPFLLLATMIMAMSLGSATAANPTALKAIEAQRRMDPTGAGSYHRVGMLREMQNTQQNLAKREQAGRMLKKPASDKR